MYECLHCLHDKYIGIVNMCYLKFVLSITIMTCFNLAKLILIRFYSP